MEKYTNYILLFGIIIIIIILFYKNYNENLSLSQFPIPTCSTNNNTPFYTCGDCGTYYQMQNKIGQACDCGGFISYPTNVKASCYKQTLKGKPNIGQLKTCVENFDINKGTCTSCTGVPACLDPGSTFESGSQELRNLPCPVPFPPVTSNYIPMNTKQFQNTSELDVYRHLENGGLLIAANDNDVVDFTFKKLVEQTLRGGNSGYPDFYYINGPIIVMNKVNGVYYWMIDYPIKYNPGNYLNYVNKSSSWKVANNFFSIGKRLLNGNAPMVFYTNINNNIQSCMPMPIVINNKKLNNHEDCNNVCLWGPKYGSGDWTARV